LRGFNDFFKLEGGGGPETNGGTLLFSSDILLNFIGRRYKNKMDVETKKRKQNFSNDEEPFKKMTKKEKKMMTRERKIRTKPNFLVIDEAKKYWETFRNENSEINENKNRSKLKNEKLKPEEIKKNEKRRFELLDKIVGHLKGKMSDVSKNQDASRIIQTVIKYGNEKHHKEVYNELKGKFVNLSQDVYGHFIVKRFLDHGKSVRKELLAEFKGEVPKMVQERFPADVIDYAYSEIANASQRYDIIKEFYGKEYMLDLNKDQKNAKSLKEVLESHPGKRESVLKLLTNSVKKAINKKLFNLHIIQKILLDCFECCNLGDVIDLILDLQEDLPHFIHTKEGVLISIYSFSFGTSNHRKKILKSFKNLVLETAKNEFGYLFLCKCLMVMDDTILLDSIILKEMKQDLLTIALDKNASKVILNLLNPLKHLTVQHQGFLNPPRPNLEETKKGKDKIKEELLEKFSPALIELVENHAEELISSDSGCPVLIEILKSVKGVKFDKIIDFISKNDMKENIHFSRQVSKLILDTDTSFPKDLFEKISNNLLDFINKQSGGFILSALAKNGFRKDIVKKVKPNSIQDKEEGGNQLLLKVLLDPK
jgi:pumilio homology domain family member 6